MAEQVIIACEVLQRHLECLLPFTGFDGIVRYLDAALHLRPQLLGAKLEEEVTKPDISEREVLVLFGKCVNGIAEICRPIHASYAHYENCYQMFLGDRYQELLCAEPGTYFLEDYLCENFERLVIKGLKLNEYPRLKELLFRHYRRAVYIDVNGEGFSDAAYRTAKYLELPLEIEIANPRALPDVLAQLGVEVD